MKKHLMCIQNAKCPDLHMLGVTDIINLWNSDVVAFWFYPYRFLYDGCSRKSSLDRSPH